MASIELTIADEPGCIYYIPQPLPAAELSRFYHTADGKTVFWRGERELPGIGFMVDVQPFSDDLSSLWKGEVCGYAISTFDTPSYGLIWLLNVLVFPYRQGFEEHNRLRKFTSHDYREISANGIHICGGETIVDFPVPNWAAAQIREGQLWKCRLIPSGEPKPKPARKSKPRKRQQP